MTDRAYVERYLAALAAGAQGDELAAFFHPEARQEEFPNRLSPAGASRDLAGILAGAASGAKVLRRQSFTLTGFVGGKDAAAAEAVWQGELAVAVGSLKPGDTMRARFSMHFEFRDGRIHRQRNYDCFDPF